ncbi:MAG: HprK-related kinase A [Rhodopila sp.]|nr:HprK-related kinase A [Rhodopila sp.]
MQLGAVPESALRARFRATGVRLRLAGLCINLRTDVPAVIEQILQLYGGYPLEPGAGTDDARVHLKYASPLRRFIGRRTLVFVDGEPLYRPMLLRHAYLMIDSALDWCVSANVTNLVLHAAVAERGGLAVILPAPSGSGKSTICAALVTRGWRLLSDELAVFRAADGRLQSFALPITLKNESIALIRQWAPDAYISPVFTGTIRGDMAFLRPPTDSVTRAAETAEPALIVSPTYQVGAPLALQPLGKSEAFRLLTASGMNYYTTQRFGFDTVAGLVDSCPAWRLSYGTLEQAVDAIEDLLARVRMDPTASRPAITTT